MLNTPMAALVLVVVFVVGNAILIFGFYLPRTSVPISDPVLVGAGDIADCASSGDEATAKLLADLSGTVYTLGDNAYESGAPFEFSECYDPSWAATKPVPGPAWATTNTTRRRPPDTSSTSVRPPAIRRRATTPTIWEGGMWLS
jgi:hypothetical protein